MKKGQILLASMIMFAAMPITILTYHRASHQYIQQLSPDQVKSLQCTFRKIYNAGTRVDTSHPIDQLLAIKEPYNSWPAARRKLLRQRLDYMKKVLDDLIEAEPYQADALANLHTRMRALKTGYTYRR